MTSHSNLQRSLSQASTATSSSRDSHSEEKKHSRKTSNPVASRILRGRSKSPAPIDIPKSNRSRQHASSLSQVQDIPRSNPDSSYLDQHSTSPVQMSPDNSSPRSPKPEFTTKRPSTPPHRNSNDYRRLSGTVNHCGRHSNDWLFGGFSVRDTVRDGIEKLRSHHDKDG
ncbi:hypothetical protein N7492_005644 [Penicillium capsulatum]|uniref:Uncharacterized protein n=1 Tax=Penicillium capsulatum TaxID=69766 RepID=A0A9W9LRV1_9EURO|nr:hypothetical protein N7492_005644 [Penicillium capsulatum]KAJ6135259.1 hypothetical protein N7512_000419 [Penicillium capsulatum]